MFPVRVRSALRFSACQSGSVPEKSTPFFRPTHCSSLKAFAFRIQLPRPERVRRPKTRVLRVGRRACLWGHPPPSPPSPGRAPLSPLHRRTGAGGEMLFHPTTEGAVPLGHCGQYYSRYTGGLFGTVNPAFLCSLSHSQHSLSQDFSVLCFHSWESPGLGCGSIQKVVLTPHLVGPKAQSRARLVHPLDSESFRRWALGDF